MSVLKTLEKKSASRGMEDVINFKKVDQGNVLMRHEFILMLAKPIVDDSPPCTSDDGRVTKSVRFADQLPMPDTKCCDTLECHRIISDTNGDAPSDRFTDRPSQGASGHIHLKGTAYQPQSLKEKKANRQGEHTLLQGQPSYLIIVRRIYYARRHERRRQ